MRYLLGLMLITSCCLIQGQDRGFYSISLSGYNHGIGLPFQAALRGPLNPGFALSAAYRWRQKAQWTRYQRLELGGYRHQHLSNGFYLKTDLVQRWAAPWGSVFEAQASLGYLRDFAFYEVFEPGPNGAYERGKAGSFGSLLVGAGLGIGHEITLSKGALVPFLRYEVLLQTPYSTFVPAMPHGMLHLGVQLLLSDDS